MTSRDVMLGTMWGLMAAFCHSFVPIAVRLLDHIPPIELVFFRNIIGLVLFLLIVSWHGFGFVLTQRFGFHFQRCFLNFAGMWLWFAGLALLPIAKAVALHFTIPLMVVPLAIILLRERPGWGRLICTLIGFGGVLIILRPGAVPIDMSVFLVLGSALSYAGVSIYTRVLGGTESPETMTFYYHALLSIFAPLSMAAGWMVATYIPAAGLSLESFQWITPGWQDTPALLLLAVAGGLAPYCLVRALVHAEATIVQPVEYLRLPITAFFAYLVFDQTTDMWVWTGAAVIVGSTYYMARHETRSRA
jgi:drug/metabolite transporter (DMT)-like permease